MVTRMISNWDNTVAQRICMRMCIVC